MARFSRQQSHEAALLIIQLQRSMSGVEPTIWIGMAIQPSPASAAHPAPQQPVRERLVSGRGGTH